LIPVALILATRGTSKRTGAGLCWLAALAGLSGTVSYYWKVTGPLATIILVLLQAAAWGFYANSARLLMETQRSWWVVWRLPLSMAMVDGLMARFSPHGACGSLATSQIDFPLVLQVASLVGSPGPIFLAGLFASVVSLAWLRRLDVEKPVLTYGLPVAVLLAASFFGAYRLSAPKPIDNLTVGLVAVDEMSGAWKAYEERTRELSAQGAELIVWAEKIEKLDRTAAQNRLQSLQVLAEELKVPIVVGVQQEASNVAWIINASGALLGSYQKQQLVPYLESDLQAGSKDFQFPLGNHKIGVVICRDLFFPSLARRYGQLGVQVVVSPAWDFYHDAKVSSAVAAIRGVESGFAVVRTAREGLLSVTDHLGRVVAQTRSSEANGVGLLARLPIKTEAPTVFARWGDWFSWLCLTLFFLLRTRAQKP
jgi:apolipoprotein N-acyltransferase